MTKNEMYKQVYNLSVDGNINRKKMSFLEFKNFCNQKFDDPKRSSVFMEILLPDGWWYCFLMRLKVNKKILWDYYIPDNKEEQKRLYTDIVKIFEEHSESVFDI